MKTEGIGERVQGRSRTLRRSRSGRGRMVVEDFTQPDVRLDYWGQTADTYAGFDRFGRVVRQLWRDYGAPADRDEYAYGYDRNSNRLYRENTLTAHKDELYAYDNLNRLTTDGDRYRISVWRSRNGTRYFSGRGPMGTDTVFRLGGAETGHATSRDTGKLVRKRVTVETYNSDGSKRFLTTIYAYYDSDGNPEDGRRKFVVSPDGVLRYLAAHSENAGVDPSDPGELNEPYLCQLDVLATCPDGHLRQYASIYYHAYNSDGRVTKVNGGECPGCGGTPGGTVRMWYVNNESHTEGNPNSWKTCRRTCFVEAQEFGGRLTELGTGRRVSE